ncbi:putative Ubiquitin-like domain superfamily, UBL3-like, ubiquitin domain-containing protein [Helianthus annuus]|nr:putative Ubiquitin-like domain superfamily, UBL3-like, ubiquitin domain-containing protein [Helianthus annuus]
MIIVEKDNAPRTVKYLKLISGRKILETNRTVDECRSPLCDVPSGVTTMHIVVSQPPQEKGVRVTG